MRENTTHGHRSRIWITGMTLLFGSMVALFAQNRESYQSLEDYLVRAQEANPQLQAFAARYEAAINRIPQVSALPDPTLQINHFVDSVQTRTGPQENVLSLGQKLPWFGKLGNREAAATGEAQALWYAFQAQQLTVAKKVATAYYDYAYIGKAIHYSRENLELLNDLRPIVEERVRGGSNLNSLLRLEVEIGKVQDKLQSFEQKRIAKSAKLSELLALPSDHPLPWPEWEAPEPENLDGIESVSLIERNNPELGMLESRIESAEARREIARLASYPDVTLGVNYIQIGEPDVNPAAPDAGKDAWGVTVSVNLPIWQNKNKAGRSEALSQKQAAESEYQNRLNGLKAEFSSSMALLEDAHRRLELYGDELLNLAKQSVEISQTSYEGGQTGILEVIDSERSLLELQLLHWRAAADAWKQRINIQTITNQPISGTFNVTKEE